MRRSILGLTLTLALGLCLAPSSSHAQAVAKIPRIGLLTFALQPYAGFEPFRRGLRDLGYVEGQSIALEYRFIGPKPTPTLLANSKSFCFSRLMCGQA
jgi:hypothetical protein